MRYAVARYNSVQRETAYRIYVTDALRIGFGIQQRFVDLLNRKPDNRTGDEIVSDVLDWICGGET